MKKELTCIVCPMGCHIEIFEENGKITVKGNTCKLGENYVKTECTNPVRVITTTVRAKGEQIIPVKTDKAIPKSMIFECMRTINELHPETNKNWGVGTVILKNILNTGANLVITAPVH